MPGWRNWQTRSVQNAVPQGLGVRISPRAQVYDKIVIRRADVVKWYTRSLEVAVPLKSVEVRLLSSALFDKLRTSCSEFGKVKRGGEVYPERVYTECNEVKELPGGSHGYFSLKY